MVKKTFAVFLSFVALVLLVSLGHGQSSKKTITLPNGDVVCDLNGVWDSLRKPYGSWSEYESHKDVVKITQKDAVFVGVKLEGKYVSKGEESIRGEFTKGGFKKVQVLTMMEGYLDCTGKISEDGNTIILDASDKLTVTLTRR